MSRVISVKAVSQATKNEVVKLDENSYKVLVTAPPVKGRANQAIIELLANYFRVPKSTISLISGLRSRRKILKIG